MGTRRPALRLTLTDHGTSAVIFAAGSLDFATTDQLEVVVCEMLRGRFGVVVDLAGVSLCDSAGLAALLRLHRRAAAAGQWLRLRGPRGHVAELLAVTGVARVIPVVGNGFQR